MGVQVALTEVWAKGGEGGVKLAEKVLQILENNQSEFRVLYDEKLSIKEKMNIIAREIYGADGVNFAKDAEKQIKELESIGLDKLPICVAKTQYSLK
jgi:formate--tetrahydrofolate ligase